MINLDQTYDGKLAVRTGKCSKRMKTMMKAYKFNDEDLTTILQFLAKFERACDANGVSKEMAL